MRILFFGSRSWTDENQIWWTMDSVSHRFPDAVIVHGAAVGADSIAERLALNFGLAVEPWYPKWHLHGKAAGPIRNQHMLQSGLDRAYGFMVGESPGSHHMMQLLYTAKVPTILTIDRGTGKEIIPFFDAEDFLPERLDRITKV